MVTIWIILYIIQVFRYLASPPYYVWPFRAEVTNNFEFPIRITEFASLTLGTDGWISPAKPFGSKEFTEWYTDGDPVEDGWIQPGATATDARSWNRMYGPVIPRVKWRYVAEDKDGNEYIAQQEVELVPHVTDQPNWQSHQALATTNLKITLTGADGSGPEYAQVRFGRFPGKARSFAVYETRDGVTNTTVPVPGLYLLEVYASGYEWTTIPLVLEDKPTNAELSVMLAPHGATDLATVVFEGAGPSANAAVAFYREWKPARDAYFTAATAYQEEHMTREGFEYDLTGLSNLLRMHYRDDTRPGLARLAGLLTFNTPGKPEQAETDYLLEMLPSDSFVWAAGPDHAMNAASRSGQQMQFVEDLASRSPDPLVRAKALVIIAHGAKGIGDVEGLTDVMDKLRTDYGDLPELAWQIDELARPVLLIKDSPMPEFDLATLEEGVRVSTDDLAGGYYLLHFWATWCGPCMAEMKSIHAAYEAYGDAGVRFISISMDRKLEAVHKLRSGRWPMPWTNVYSGDDPDFDERFGIRSIPALFLVSPEGVIVETSGGLRGEDLEETLGKYVRR